MSQPASIARRLGAAFYDLLVVAALWMFVYFALIGAGAFAGTQGDSLHPGHLALRLAIAFAYFAFCWLRGGQTLGLMVWKLRLVRADGAPIVLRDASARFALCCLYLVPFAALEVGFRLAVPATLYYIALLGPFLLGLLLSRRDAQGRALHELALVTRVTKS